METFNCFNFGSFKDNQKDLFPVVKGIKNYDFNIENISVYLWLFSTFSRKKHQYLKGLQDPARKVPGTYEIGPN